MDRWTLVHEQLRDFRRYLYDGFQSLEIKPLHDLTTDRVRDRPKYLESRGSGLFQCCGVYVFFDTASTLTPLYVASEVWAFDKRFLQHPEVEGARYIDVIAFDHCHWPFMLALEAFLIARLKPNFNNKLKGYEVEPLRAVPVRSESGA